MLRKFGIVFLIFFVFLVSVPTNLLFFDAPEYVGIVTENSFWESLFLGHPPAHPVFMGSLWIVSHLLKLVSVPFSYAANLFSLIVFVGCSLLIVKIFQKLKISWVWGLVLICMSPLVYLVSTNLIVEILTFFWYLVLINFLLVWWEKPKLPVSLGIILTLVLGVFSHLEIIFWIPSAVGVIVLTKMVDKQSMNKILSLVSLLFLGCISSLVIYLGALYSQDSSIFIEDFRGLLIQLTGLTTTGNWGMDFLRWGRNVSGSVFWGFGVIPLLLIFIYWFKNIKKQNVFWGTVLFGISVVLSGGLWWGDLMSRRVMFAGLFIVIFLVKYFSKYLKYIAFVMFILWLPVFISNCQIWNTSPLMIMKNQQKMLPKGSTLIQTQYVRPFTDFMDKKVILLGVDDSINIAAGQGKVFMDSQAVFAPYLLYVGNNLHQTSLGKIGKSEGKEILINNYYNLHSVGSAEKRVFIYELLSSDESWESRLEKLRNLKDENTIIIWGKTVPGQTISVYSKNLFDRLNTQRLNYGDSIIWLISLATGHKDPVLWTYSDKSGYFAFPLSRKLENNFYLESIEKIDYSVVK